MKVSRYKMRAKSEFHTIRDEEIVTNNNRGREREIYNKRWRAT